MRSHMHNEYAQTSTFFLFRPVLPTYSLFGNISPLSFSGSQRVADVSEIERRTRLWPPALALARPAQRSPPPPHWNGVFAPGASRVAMRCLFHGVPRLPSKTRALCSTLDKVTPGPSARSASSDQVDPEDEWLALVDTNNRRRSLTDRSHQERLRSVQMSLRSTMPAINGTPRGTDCPVRSDPCVSCARRENSFL